VRSSRRHPWRETPAYRRALRSGALPQKGHAFRSNRCADPAPPGLLRGIDEFNRQEYYECHETLEAIWLKERDSIRYLYQGILQVGVGFYHWRRGNWRGAVGELRYGLEKLEAFRPQCMSIDVERLVGEASALLAMLEQLGADRLPPFPPPGLPTLHRVPEIP